MKICLSNDLGKKPGNVLQGFLATVACLKDCAAHFWKLQPSPGLLHPPCTFEKKFTFLNFFGSVNTFLFPLQNMDVEILTLLH